MLQINPQSILELNRTQTYRTICTLAVTDAAELDERVVYVVADLGRAMQGQVFYEKYPDRYVQVGIAEQNLIGVSAGLWASGLIPFATTFAPFATLRCLEQIRVDCAYANANVKILGTESGVSMGHLGVTHLGWEDLGVMRPISGLTIISPADGVELYKSILAAKDYDGSVYIRVPGGKMLPQVYAEEYDFCIGKSILMCDGSDVSIIATGSAVKPSLLAAQKLREMGVHAAVINMHTIKPLDDEAVRCAVNKTRRVVSVEEHSITGGLGTAVAEVLAEYGAGKLLRIGLPDAYPSTVSPYQAMLTRYKLTVDGIVDSILGFQSETYAL